MQKLMITSLLGVLLAGCDAQDIDLPATKGGKQTGGAGGMATTTGGTSGSTITTGTAGSVGAGGSNGLGGSNESGGSGGAIFTDASGGLAGSGLPGADGSVPAADSGAGPGYPEASTCAGYALSFNNFAYGTSARPVQDDFTLEAWIKTTDARTGMNNFYEGSGLIYADVGGMADDFGSSVLNGKFAFGVGNPDTTILSTTTVNTGQWIHVAATRKMSTGAIQIFVNGVMEASATAQLNSLNANTMLTLGANPVDSRYYTGAMDEVRIWSVVRTQADISGNMHKRMVGNEPGLVAYFRFDEPGSDAAKDSSSSGASSSQLFGPPEWVVSDAPICN